MAIIIYLSSNVVVAMWYYIYITKNVVVAMKQKRIGRYKKKNGFILNTRDKNFLDTKKFEDTLRWVFSDFNFGDGEDMSPFGLPRGWNRVFYALCGFLGITPDWAWRDMYRTYLKVLLYQVNYKFKDEVLAQNMEILLRDQCVLPEWMLRGFDLTDSTNIQRALEFEVMYGNIDYRTFDPEEFYAEVRANYYKFKAMQSSPIADFNASFEREYEGFRKKQRRKELKKLYQDMRKESEELINCLPHVKDKKFTKRREWKEYLKLTKEEKLKQHQMQLEKFKQEREEEYQNYIKLLNETKLELEDIFKKKVEKEEIEKEEMGEIDNSVDVSTKRNVGLRGGLPSEYNENVEVEL